MAEASAPAEAAPGDPAHAERALTAGPASLWATTPRFPTADTFTLTYNPNAKKTIYLDFNGHTMSGTLWNQATSTRAARPSIALGAFDLDDKPGSFSAREHAMIQQAFLSVREDFGVFDVRITTQDPGVEALRKTSASDDRYGIRVVVTQTDSNSCDCGGQAYLSSFAAATDTPAYVLTSNARYTANAISHEIGHTLGLGHDGLTDAATGCSATPRPLRCSYYGGHGDWAPIMGADTSSTRRITQWSKGEDRDANNKQDDIAVMQSVGGFGLVADTNFGSWLGATPTTLGTTHRGIPINQAGDVDAWRFTVPTTRKVTIDATNWYGGTVDSNLNLRVRLGQITTTLGIPSGKVIATANPTATTTAKLTATPSTGPTSSLAPAPQGRVALSSESTVPEAQRARQAPGCGEGNRMKRRVVGSLGVVTAALVLTSCQPLPPAGWKPPVVIAVVTPDPVVAGEPFTIDVTAVDPKTTVTEIDIEIRPPYRLVSAVDPVYPDVECEAGELSAGTTATRSFTCMLPEHAPNGAWRLRSYASNPGSTLYRGNAYSTFELTGGTDDHAPPTLESAEISPDPVVIGEPFAVTIRAFDEHHLPPAPTTLSATIVLPTPPEGAVAWTCSPVTPTSVDDTVLEWRFTDCLIPAGSTPWTYAGGFTISDTIGHRGRLSVVFQAVAPE